MGLFRKRKSDHARPVESETPTKEQQAEAKRKRRRRLLGGAYGSGSAG